MKLSSLLGVILSLVRNRDTLRLDSILQFLIQNFWEFFWPAAEVDIGASTP